ncbi:MULTISPECIES: hypothetical protein [Saliphagus]|uniref:DUF8106 domain-containing protein n=1 Tax=Saliphagus infecundisoli TaxID=1849069 RepID=A0ABD5QIY0_9EURY|nr:MULTISPECIES: hypothetical protein [Saliphagus]
MTQPSTDRKTRPPPDRTKHTLFCPACGHEAAIDGDWEVIEEDGERVLSCPRCGEVVDRRPRRGRRPLVA